MTDPIAVFEAFREFDANATDSDNARRVLLATVDPAYTGPPAIPRVTFDGETVLSTKTYQYLGQAPLASSRVLMQPMGSTHLIMGPIGGQEHIIAGVQRLPTPGLTSYVATASGSQSLTTTQTDIAGTSITFTCGTNAVLIALGKFDLRISSANISYAVGALLLDGTTVNECPMFGTAPDWPAGEVMHRAILASGSHTVKLRQWKAASGGSAETEAHTRLMAMVWE